VTKKQLRPPPPPKEISAKEQIKIDWVKDVRILANIIQRDNNLFKSFKFKGGALVHDKQSGVTKELMGAIEAGTKQIQAQGEIISEVLVMGTLVHYNEFDPQIYANKVDKAKQVMVSLLDLKGKGLRIIGK
jgi:hypothetical protein